MRVKKATETGVGYTLVDDVGSVGSAKKSYSAMVNDADGALIWHSVMSFDEEFDAVENCVRTLSRLRGRWPKQWKMYIVTQYAV